MKDRVQVTKLPFTAHASVIIKPPHSQEGDGLLRKTESTGFKLKLRRS